MSHSNNPNTQDAGKSQWEKVCDVKNRFDNQNENTSAMLQIVKAGDR